MYEERGTGMGVEWQLGHACVKGERARPTKHTCSTRQTDTTIPTYTTIQTCATMQARNTEH